MTDFSEKPIVKLRVRAEINVFSYFNDDGETVREKIHVARYGVDQLSNIRRSHWVKGAPRVLDHYKYKIDVIDGLIPYTANRAKDILDFHKQRRIIEKIVKKEILKKCDTQKVEIEFVEFEINVDRSKMHEDFRKRKCTWSPG